MSDVVDLSVEIRKQRHEFILHYYDMAVKDLDRHLMVGWQTLAIAATSIVTLSIGFRNYLPIPTAVAAAIAIAYWGMLNVLDADYWALRAIAFLANVEAVYFYRDDQSVFNPYAGRHPPFTMLSVLKAQFIACMLFAVISVIFLFWSAAQTHDLSELRISLAQTTTVSLAYWLIPVPLFIFLLDYVVVTRRNRIRDYLNFVTNSPGPGMLCRRDQYRGVDLVGNASAADIISGEEIQKPVRSQLQALEGRWSVYCIVLHVTSVGVALAFVIVTLFHRRLFA